MPSLSRRDPDILVKIDGVPAYQAALLTATMSVNSSSPDSCTFELRKLTSKRETDLQLTQLHTLLKNDLCEVSIKTRDDLVEGGFTQVVHFGRLVAMHPEISAGGEVIVYTSRLDEHLFGRPVEFLYAGSRDPEEPDTEGIDTYLPTFVDGDTTFNPVFDGIATPNRSLGLIGGLDYHVFIDPGSVDSKTLEEDRKAEESGSTGSNVVAFWTVADAANYLCKTLNPDETYVKNPTDIELYFAIGTRDGSGLLRNFTVPLGTFLPRALDELLYPRGFGWRVVYKADSRVIEVFERGGQGERKFVLLQPFDARLITNATNLASFSADLDYVDGAGTHFAVMGGYEEREVSIILRPGWDSKYDTMGTDSLRRSDRGIAEWENDIELQQAWRRFVANESGHYTGRRPWWDSALDLTVQFDNPILRRRRLYPTITQDETGAAIGTHQGVFLEYWNCLEQDWKPVIGAVRERVGLSDGQFQILQDEIGILFSADTPPYQLQGYSTIYGMDQIALRVTASVRGDKRMRGSLKATDSFLADEKKQIVDAARQYQLRTISHANPADLTIPIGGTTLSSPVNGETDGRIRAGVEARDLLDKFNTANLGGTCVIEGVDWNLTGFLGQALEKIKGRDIFLGTTTKTLHRNPTVTRLEFDVQQQKTTISFEAVR